MNLLNLVILYASKGILLCSRKTRKVAERDSGESKLLLLERLIPSSPSKRASSKQHGISSSIMMDGGILFFEDGKCEGQDQVDSGN